MNNTILRGLIKIDEPMGRETYFKFSICLIALQILLVLMYAGITFTVKIPAQFVLMFLAFMFLVEIPFLYMFFVLCTKRIWDITDDKFNALWISAIALIFSLFIPPMFVLMFIVLVLLPSRGK